MTMHILSYEAELRIGVQRRKEGRKASFFI